MDLEIGYYRPRDTDTKGSEIQIPQTKRFVHSGPKSAGTTHPKMRIPHIQKFV